MKDVRIVNLSNYTTPKIVEERTKEWVKYGEDNNYYQYLIDRYNGSATNNAIINGLSEMIYGQGLDATDSSRRPDEYAKMKSLFTKDCVRKLVLDLKLMGQCAMQIIYSKDRKSIAEVEHFPIETLRMGKAEDGEIKSYYYHPEWSKIKHNEKPDKIPAFGTSNEAIEIYCVKPYRAGFYYYSPVDYQGGLQYAELEEEIANYHLNNIKNGLAPSMLINFNNGIPNEEERTLIENRIYEKFSGSSNSGKFILSFNDNTETQANIEPVQLSDAHNQYEFLSTESAKKVLVSHRIVSPMLFGIKDQTGLGNNADELKTASILTDNVVVKPFQNLLIDAFDQILAFNGVSLKLYFKTLQPLEFTDVDNIEDKETKEEETGVKMSSHKIRVELADQLIALGEDEEQLLSQGWVLYDERAVDYDQEEALDKMLKLASTGTARSNAKSEQDQTVNEKQFKVRYQYAPLQSDSESREFCSKMVAAKKLYRKEDIIAMGKKSANPVNPGWGPNGADTYSIWLYKGGGSCRHFWMRKTFVAEGVAPDVKNPNAEVSVNEAKKSGLKPTKNDPKVAKRARDIGGNKRGFLEPKKWNTDQGKAF